MSGIVASIADALILGNIAIALTAIGALLFFLLGAATTAVLVNWAKRRKLESVYALPLLLEAVLLLIFGLVGANFNTQIVLLVSLTVMLLCFLMGLQNALITKISHARIRTTHVTGMVTDMGIELGKLFYVNAKSGHAHDRQPVLADRDHLMALASLVSLFFLGGLVGAAGFKFLGFAFTLPLAALVAAIGLIPAWDDVQAAIKSRLL